MLHPSATPNPSKEGTRRTNREHGMLASTIQISNNNPTNPIHQATTRHQAKEARRTNHHTPQGAIVRSFRTQQRVTTLPLPTNSSLSTHTPRRRHAVLRTTGRPGSSHSSTIPLVRHHHAHPYIRWASGCVLLRKEVIQPHLPVRLPCYDFVPIASPTFDRSPQTSWLGHGLRVLPTFVT